MKRLAAGSSIACGILALVSCAGGDDRVAAQHPATSAAPAVQAVDGPAVVGAPYSIGGRSYTPEDVHDYDTVGYASWYGGELAGHSTASGEPFNPAGVTAAHRTLPLPSYVEVTRLDTGKTILVRINDRGPGNADRLIDLSMGAAEELGISSQGAVAVRVRRTFPVDSERAALLAGHAVPPRLDTPESLLTILRERAALLPRPAGQGTAMAADTPPQAPATRVRRPAPATAGHAPTAPAHAPTAPAHAPTAPAAATTAPASAAAVAAPVAATPAAAAGPFIVQLGSFASRARADALARRLNATVVPSGSVFRVRYGPFASAALAQAAVARARSLGQPGAVILHDQ